MVQVIKLDEPDKILFSGREYRCQGRLLQPIAFDNKTDESFTSKNKTLKRILYLRCSDGPYLNFVLQVNDDGSLEAISPDVDQ